MRPVVGASAESGVEVRMVIQSVDVPLLGSVNGPVKDAPASTTIVSPGCAELIAACKLPPAATVRVAARVEAELKATRRSASAEIIKRLGSE